MRNMMMRLAGGFAVLAALAMPAGTASAQDAKMKVTIAVGGGACLCYLPTMLAKEIGAYDKAGLEVELVDLKGGSQADRKSVV